MSVFNQIEDKREKLTVFSDFHYLYNLMFAYNECRCSDELPHLEDIALAIREEMDVQMGEFIWNSDEEDILNTTGRTTEYWTCHPNKPMTAFDELCWVLHMEEPPDDTPHYMSILAQFLNDTTLPYQFEGVCYNEPQLSLFYFMTEMENGYELKTLTEGIETAWEKAVKIIGEIV